MLVSQITYDVTARPSKETGRNFSEAKFFAQSMHKTCISFFFLCSIATIQPGVMKTRALSQFTFNTGQLPNDDPTKLLAEKYLKARGGLVLNQAQTPEEVAEYILKAITDEKPQPHYMTSEALEEFVKSKYRDLTDRIPFEMSKTFLQ